RQTASGRSACARRPWSRGRSWSLTRWRAKRTVSCETVAEGPRAMRRLNGSDAPMLYLDGGVNARLAGYKRPRFVVQVDAIKRAADGKPGYPWARDLTEIERASSPA